MRVCESECVPRNDSSETQVSTSARLANEKKKWWMSLSDEKMDMCFEVRETENFNVWPKK